jgi:hypothetical protein
MAVPTLPDPTIEISRGWRGSLDEKLSAMFRSSGLRTPPSIDQQVNSAIRAAA